MAGTTSGRADQYEWLTPRGRRNLILVTMAALLAAGWQLAVALTCHVGLTDVDATLAAVTAAEPIKGLPGTDHAAAGTVLAVWAVCVGVLGGVLLTLVCWFVAWRARRRRGKGLADGSEIATTVGQTHARKEAEQTLPSLSAKQVAAAAPAQLGLVLGCEDRSGEMVVIGHNDAISVMGGSGAGKSSSVMAPAALEARGPLVVTSNEVGILDVIAKTRQKLGRVWVFDPLDRACWPDPMVYNPVAGCRDGQVALARGTAFVAGCGADGQDSTNAGFFRTNAKIAMRVLLHAAALDGRTIEDVLAWVPTVRHGAKTPLNVLRGSSDPAAEHAWEAILESVSTGADDTVSSTLNTLSQVVDPLTLNSIRRWLVPREGAPTFNAAKFVASSDTLVLLSDDSTSTNVGPLATMLFQEVVDAIKAYAPFTRYGRLDPPMRIVGDEIANIAPIDKLPEMSTELRKLGVQIILAFQAEEQLQTRWGAERGRLLLQQMAAEVVLPGVKSTDTLNRYSDLAGTVDVLERTINRDADGERSGDGAQLQERKILRPDEIRRMPDGQGLLIWRNARGMLITMQPWYTRDYHGQVAQDEKDTRAARAKERMRRDLQARQAATQRESIA